MKTIVALSDLHGVLPIIKNAETIDYLLIGGDIVPENVQISPNMSYRWIKTDFLPWCSQFKKVILIAGNHDFVLALWGKKIKWPNNIVYLDNEYYEDNFVSVYGSANMKVFGQFFCKGSDRMSETFKGFSKDGKKHIVLLHMPSYHTNDYDYMFYGHYHTLDNTVNEVKNSYKVNVKPKHIKENVSYSPRKTIKGYTWHE